MSSWWKPHERASVARDATALCVVGEPHFLGRYAPLVKALRHCFGAVDVAPVAERALLRKMLFLAGDFVRGRVWPIKRAAVGQSLARFRKQPSTFVRLSRRSARSVCALRRSPALILQIFSMWSPVTQSARRPYAHYVDMTMAMTKRHWPAWAPFAKESRYHKWIALEGASYRGAERVFTFSEETRRSLIEEYGVLPHRAVTVGAAGHYESSAVTSRTYGRRTIVFNGSDFSRKGGDLVLAAFRLVKERFADALLTIVANTEVAAEFGVHLPGNVNRTTLFAIFDQSDVVLAPTRLDVFPGFVLEAMSRGAVPVLSGAVSMDEMIRDGVEGYVVFPTTPDRLAARIISLFEKPAMLREFGDAARARIASDWNWNRVAEKMFASLHNDGDGLDSHGAPTEKRIMPA